MRSTLWVTLLILLVGGVLWLTGEDVHWGGVIVTAILYGAIYFVGANVARRRSRGTVEDLMLARRSLPLWLAAFTMSATWVGGGYVNGTAESTYASGLVWVQAPWGYALSLVVGGLLFARVMRRHGFTTMLDPLEARFGRRMAAVLYLPALSGELFWTGAILVALGTTFGTVLGVEFVPSILLSALIAVTYTLIGGLWAVALTDVLQLAILVVGLWLVVPLAAGRVGGLGSVWSQYAAETGDALALWPPWGAWRDPAWGDLYWSWWDSALLLVFGGIPWHVYFQRVLSARDEDTAVRLSLVAAVVCLLAAVPAVLIGAIGSVADWQAMGAPAPPDPSLILPWVLRYLTGPIVASLGLGALAAAVMSSVDSSILSASSMGAWNIYRPLWRPDAGPERLRRVIRRAVVLVGTAATLIALQVQSVYRLWVLCSDLVYCLLFPQLTAALFDARANRYGSAAGLLVASILRLGGGVPSLGLPVLLPYPMIDPASGAVLFPFRTLAMLSGLGTILLVSRLTADRCPPRPLGRPTGRSRGG